MLRTLLWTGGAVLLAAAGLAVAAAALWPLPDIAAASPVLAEAGLRPGAGATRLPPLSEFEPAWQVKLRRPLTDTAAARGAVAGAGRAGPDVRLVGTIVDGGPRPRGIFVVGAGTAVELKAVGEKAGGAEILSIEEGSATVSYDGRPVTLKLEKIDVLGVGDLPAPPAPSARSTGGAAGGS